MTTTTMHAKVADLGFELLRLSLTYSIAFKDGQAVSIAEVLARVGKGKHRSWPEEVYELIKLLELELGFAHVNSRQGIETIDISFVHKLPDQGALEASLSQRLASATGRVIGPPPARPRLALEEDPIPAPSAAQAARRGPPARPPKTRSLPRLALLDD